MARVDVALVVGGRFHDFDYARLELLKHLADIGDDVRVKVWTTTRTSLASRPRTAW